MTDVKFYLLAKQDYRMPDVETVGLFSSRDKIMEYFEKNRPDCDVSANYSGFRITYHLTHKDYSYDHLDDYVVYFATPMWVDKPCS